MKMQNHLVKILHYFQRSPTASVAKERLQIIIAHERGQQNKPNYLAALQKDLLNVVAKYVNININDVKIELENKEGCSILELNVVLPTFSDNINL